MKEKQNQGKEIWLHPKELKQMLKGSLSWADVVARLNYEQEKVPETSCSALKGVKVVLLLGGTLLLTMVTWVYFVFYIVRDKI
ncbi:MAG TPA: hypothetical protein VN370_04030 [Desulfitobacteriaceae bacterium]|jgi:hypothetical protein|nr:hypothetical protein [Desulfitobacteriaceae bacterium]